MKNILFRFDAEHMHELVSQVMPYLPLLPGQNRNEILEQQIWQKKFSSPIGLAAGFDKTGKLFSCLHRYGFSFAEIGTFTLLAQEGNSKPRVFRFVPQQALFNRMGFNNPGIAHGIANLSKGNSWQSHLGVSIGKGKNTKQEEAIDDYLLQIEQLKKSALADKLLYIAINISSPNTVGLRKLQEKKYFKSFIRQIVQASNWAVVVKFAPDFLEWKQLQDLAEVAVESGVQGIIVTNTSNQHALLSKAEQITKAGGGISGAPLRNLSLTALQKVHAVVQGQVTLIASGGILNMEDVWLRLQEGATLVQVYSGFVYNGPLFVQKIHKQLIAKMQHYQLNSIEEIPLLKNK